jgi:hypothetical protein
VFDFDCLSFCQAGVSQSILTGVMMVIGSDPYAVNPGAREQMLAASKWKAGKQSLRYTIEHLQEPV